MSAKRARTRRVRRQAKAGLRNKAAKPTHKLIAGRTGSVAAKKRASRPHAKTQEDENYEFVFELIEAEMKDVARRRPRVSSVIVEPWLKSAIREQMSITKEQMDAARASAPRLFADAAKQLRKEFGP